jgi:hypothetical protein
LRPLAAPKAVRRRGVIKGVPARRHQNVHQPLRLSSLASYSDRITVGITS